LDLSDIVEFIRRERPAAARALLSEIDAAVSHLSRHPRAGAIVPELQDQGIADYRQLSVPPYRVIYAVRAKSIDIVALLDARRDLETVLWQRMLL
jgi:plasmid stabilization system protein ParE